MFSQREDINAVPAAAKPRKGMSPRRTVMIPKMMENLAKNPAKRFESGATREIFSKTTAESGRTEKQPGTEGTGGEAQQGIQPVDADR